MANPLWKAGMEPMNPAGRPKHSVRTVKGMVERFIKRNVTPNKLQKMFDTLNEKEKLNMLTELLPYVSAKQTAESLSPEDIDTLYDNLMKAANGTSFQHVDKMSNDEKLSLLKLKQAK